MWNCSMALFSSSDFAYIVTFTTKIHLDVPSVVMCSAVGQFIFSCCWYAWRWIFLWAWSFRDLLSWRFMVIVYLLLQLYACLTDFTHFLGTDISYLEAIISSSYPILCCWLAITSSIHVSAHLFQCKKKGFCYEACLIVGQCVLSRFPVQGVSSQPMHFLFKECHPQPMHFLFKECHPQPMHFQP